MKVLVAYMSQTGNTKKVAEAIYQEIGGDKEIKRLDEVKSLAGYDLAFLGFPVHAAGPDKKAKNFLESQTKGCKVALFVTHGTPEGHEELLPCLAKFRETVAGATLLGMFDCRGQMAKAIHLMMRLSSDPEWRRRGKDNSDQGLPDAPRIELARAFAREIMQQAAS